MKKSFKLGFNDTKQGSNKNTFLILSFYYFIILILYLAQSNYFLSSCTLVSLSSIHQFSHALCTARCSLCQHTFCQQCAPKRGTATPTIVVITWWASGLGLTPGYLCSSSAAEGFIKAATLMMHVCKHVCECVCACVSVLPHLTVFRQNIFKCSHSNCCCCCSALSVGVPEI